MKIVGVKFDNDEQIFYYHVNDLKLNKNVTVIVEDDKTLRFGKVATKIYEMEKEKESK